MKKINVFCVLVLALMLIDMVVDLFLNTSDANIELIFEKESLVTLLFALIASLVAFGAIVVAVVSFVKFVLNVNRNEVFTEKNVKLIRKYGYCALLCGVFLMFLTFFFVGRGFWDAVVDGLDALGEGFFALLIAEVFCIGMKLQENHP
jgi:hypothetical protein